MSHAPSWGLTFSQRGCARLGLDPEEALRAVLIHLKPQLLRLPLDWDAVAPEPGRYSFESVQAQLDLVEQFRCRVLLDCGAGGASPARPAWLGSNEQPPNERLLANLMLMLERAVAQLADYNCIDAWELGLAPAGDGSAHTSRQLTSSAVTVVHEVDPRARPVVVTPGRARGSGDRAAALHLGDVLGATLDSIPSSGSVAAVVTRFSARWQLRAAMQLAARRGKQVWITQLPAGLSGSPEPAALPDRLRAAAELALTSWAARAYLEGVEAWLLRRDQGDEGCWRFARELLRQAEQPR